MLTTLLVIFALVDQSPVPSRRVLGPSQAEVISADVISVGRTRVRLWGISLSRSDGSCPDYGVGVTCTKGAVWELNHIIQDHEVRCELFRMDDPEGRTGHCEVRYDACYGTTCTSYWRDLAKELISAGVVIQDREESLGHYDSTEESARSNRAGLWREHAPDSAPAT